MAINYLNSLDLNKNYINNAAIQNLAAEPTADTPGQIYFNTVSQTLRITEEILPATDPKTYKWVSVSGDITGLIAGTDITITDENGPTPTINQSDITRTDSANADSPSYGGTFDAVDTITTSATGHVTAVNVKTFTLPTIAYDLNKAANSGNLVLSKDGTAQDTIAFTGTTNQIEINVATEDSYTFGLADGSFVEWGTTGTNLQLPEYAVAKTPASGDNSTKVATTAFVQASVTGLLEFKGGFDANTGTIDGGTTNLTKNNQPSAGDETVAVAVGDYYVVTADGNFFGNTDTPLTVGDSVIVQTAALAGASVEGDFIVVQSDTDLATATTVGLGNVVPGTSATVTAPYVAGTATIDVVDSAADQKGAVIVEGDDPITVTYASGTATVGIEDSAADQKGAVIVAASTGISVAYASGTATVTNTDTNTINTATGTIAAGDLVGTVTHAFGINTIVQTIDSSGNTVYCDVSRTATTSVATITAVQATDITILVQKIG
jgi:hypothetical protein